MGPSAHGRLGAAGGPLAPRRDPATRDGSVQAAQTPFVAPRVRDLNEDGVAEWLDVQAAFKRLSPRERAALISVAILGFSPDEASTPLGMSPGAVRAAVSRARDKLESER